MYADPFESEEAVRQCLEDYEQSQNPYFFAIRDKASGKVLGTFFTHGYYTQKSQC